jgi:hypothetical protein
MIYEIFNKKLEILKLQTRFILLKLECMFQ